MRKVGYPASFNPATGVIDASNIAGFNPALALTILDTTAAGRPILYDLSTPGLGFAGVSGSVMTLDYDTSGLSSSDTVVIFWDDGQSTGDAVLALAAALQPAVLADNIAALTEDQLEALAVALIKALPSALHAGIPNAGEPFVNADGFVVISQ